MRAHAFLVTLSFAVIAGACQLITGIDKDAFEAKPPLLEAGPAQDADTTCLPNDLPGPPPPSGDNNDEKRPIVFALRHVGIGGIGDARPIGYNLDKRCACSDIDPIRGNGNLTCRLPADPLVEAGCDDDGGVDNALAAVFRASGFTEFVLQALNDDFEKGVDNFVLVVRDYDFRTSDVQVGVLGVPTRCLEGYDNDVDASVNEDLDAGPSSRPCSQNKPNFDGHDVYYVDSKVAVSNGSISSPFYPPRQFGTPVGYVTDHKLVIDIRKNPYQFDFTFGSQALRMGSAVITARLVPQNAAGEDLAEGDTSEPARFRLVEGVISGRVEVKGALELLSNANIPGDSTPLCKSTLGKSYYDDLRDKVCQARDVSALPKNDNADLPCDAVSVAFTFEGYEAHLGANHDVPTPAPNDCNHGCD